MTLNTQLWLLAAFIALLLMAHETRHLIRARRHRRLTRSMVAMHLLWSAIYTLILIKGP